MGGEGGGTWGGSFGQDFGTRPFNIIFSPPSQPAADPPHCCPFA